MRAARSRSAREGDASLWVPLTPGAHTVRLAGRLAAAESIPLAFPQAPRTIDVSARGWTVSGVNEGRLVAGSLELARERSAQRSGATLAAGSRVSGVRARRSRIQSRSRLDARHHVTRIAPQRAALSVEIPLVAGESVLTPGSRCATARRRSSVSGPARIARSWRSGLARAETIELRARGSVARSEVWSFVVNPQWNVSFEGFPPVLPEDVDAPVWVFRFMPRPGEKLIAQVTRPKAAKRHDARDRLVRASTRPSASARRTPRSSSIIAARRAGVTSSSCPRGARHRSDLRRTPVQLRPEKGELPLALTPGAHSVEITWEESRDVGLRTHPLDGGPALARRATSHQVVTLPESRWSRCLRVAGRRTGDALLGRARGVRRRRVAARPLAALAAALLRMAAARPRTFHAVVVRVLADRGVADRRCAGAQTGGRARSCRAVRFNAVQVLLALFTLFTIATLVFSGIRNGLLSSPDMGVAGTGSYGNSSAGSRIRPRGRSKRRASICVPMWVYRALFFAWASWMAFALVRWLRWAFNAWKSGGLWK